MRTNIDEVKALVETNLPDDQIDSIIALANKRINSLVGEAVDDKLTLAELYLSVSFLLKRLKTNGELPDSLKVGEINQNIKIDQQIKSYEEEAMKLVREYKLTNNFVPVYARAGSSKELDGDYR